VLRLDFLAPSLLQQVIPLESGLYNVVVLGVALLQEELLHNCELVLVYSKEATLRLAEARLRSYLLIDIEKHLFT